MLVIDHVVLHLFDQGPEVVNLEDEHTILFQQEFHPIHDAYHVINMGK